MSENNAKSRKWYKHGWGLVAAILFFPYFLIWYAWAESKWSKGVKVGVTVITSIIMLPIIIGVATAEPEPSQPPASSNQKVEKKETVKKETPKESFSDKLLGLISSKKAFDSGSYVKGDIPKGEYAFVSF